MIGRWLLDLEFSGGLTKGLARHPSETNTKMLLLRICTKKIHTHMYRAGLLLTFGDFMPWQTGTENQNVKHWREFLKIPWMNLIVWLKNKTDSFLNFLQPPNILLGRYNKFILIHKVQYKGISGLKGFLKERGKERKEYQKENPFATRY